MTRALEQVIYQDVYEISVILAGVGIVVLVLIAIALIMIISKVTKPIEKLTNTIIAVTEGDFTTDV